MPEDKYYKVAESDLVEIADAIRLQKNGTNKYKLKDFAKIIKAMLVLPSGLVETQAKINTESDATGNLPKIYHGNVDSDMSVRENSTCVGTIPTVIQGIASSITNMSIDTSAVGELTE